MAVDLAPKNAAGAALGVVGVASYIGAGIHVNDEKNASNPYGFENTKLGELPSTGGMGTYLFTIIGVVVMVGAAGAFFISRRRESEE